MSIINLQENPIVHSILNNLKLNDEILTFSPDNRTKIRTLYNPNIPSNNNPSIANSFKSFEFIFQARKKNYNISVYPLEVIIELDNRYILTVNGNGYKFFDKEQTTDNTIFNINTKTEFGNNLIEIDNVILLTFRNEYLFSAHILGNIYLSVTNNDKTLSHLVTVFPTDIELNYYGKPDTSTYSLNIDRILYDGYNLPPEYGESFSLNQYDDRGNMFNSISLFVKFVDTHAQLDVELSQQYDMGMGENYDPEFNEQYNSNILGKHRININDENYGKRQRN